MINAYLKLVLKAPATFLVILLLISIGLCLGMKHIWFDHSIEAFMPKDDPKYIEYEKSKKIFGDNSRFLIMAVSHTDLWSVPAFEAFDRFLTDIEAYKGLDETDAKKTLARFRSLIDKPHIRFSDLTDAFPENPAFVRLLRRKTPPRVRQKQVLAPGNIKRLKKAVKQDYRLRETELIDSILSPFTSNDITGKEDVLETYHLLGKNDRGERIIPQNRQEIARFKNRLKRNPAFKNGIYAVNPKTGEITDFALIVKFAKSEGRPRVVGEIIDIAESYSELEIIMSGVPYVSRQFNTYMESDLYRTIPLVLLVVTLVFYLNFRSIRGVLLPLMTLGMAEIWTVGLMGHLGYPITTIGITLPPLLISVGSSYAIHVLNQYYAEFDLIPPSAKRRGLKTHVPHQHNRCAGRANHGCRVYHPAIQPGQRNSGVGRIFRHRNSVCGFHRHHLDTRGIGAASPPVPVPDFEPQTAAKTHTG